MIDSPATLDDLAAKLDALLEHGPRVDCRYLSVDGAAQYCSLSAESIRRLLSSGKLTPLRPVKGRIVIYGNQLDTFVLSSDARPRTGRGSRERSDH